MTNSLSNFEKLTAKPQRLRKPASNRAAYTIQSQSTQTQSIYVAAHNFSDVREALEILPSGAMIRDAFTPTGEIWACTTAAGEGLGEGITLAEDFT